MMWLSNLKIWEGHSLGAIKDFIESKWDWLFYLCFAPQDKEEVDYTIRYMFVQKTEKTGKLRLKITIWGEPHIQIKKCQCNLMH